MKRSFFVAAIFAILLFSISCDRIEYIKINGENLYQITDEYFPTIENLEPPHLLRIDRTELIGSEIYRVQWNNRAMIATQYPAKNSIHHYYVVLPNAFGLPGSPELRRGGKRCMEMKDSVLTGDDVVLGPLTQRQRDSVISVHRIDTAGMQVIDFN